jgi:hypothetical protein
MWEAGAYFADAQPWSVGSRNHPRFAARAAPNRPLLALGLHFPSPGPRLSRARRSTTPIASWIEGLGQELWLHWESIHRMLPEGGIAYDEAHIREMIAAGLIENISPEPFLERTMKRLRQRFEDRLRKHQGRPPERLAVAPLPAARPSRPGTDTRPRARAPGQRAGLARPLPVHNAIVRRRAGPARRARRRAAQARQGLAPWTVSTRR